MRQVIQQIQRQAMYFAVACVVGLIACITTGWDQAYGPLAVMIGVYAALGFAGCGGLKQFTFTMWVLAGVTAAMFYPSWFGTWGGFELTLLIVPLTQVIMFGMGTTLSLRDFSRVAASPWPVMIGAGLQYLIMPLTGYALVRAFGFEGDLAVGVILIGACSGGVASNLMTYLAGGNVALSVTMTCISTFISPLLTPTMMKLLAGAYVEVDFVRMMLSIFNIIIVPVVVGLVAHSLLYGRHPAMRRAGVLWSFGIACGIVAYVASWPAAASLGIWATLRSGIIVGLVMLGVVAAAKAVISVAMGRSNDWMDRALPLVSMAGICAILAIITAQTRNVLLAVGLSLIAAAVIHNTVGYVLGYWCSRVTGGVLGRLGYAMGLVQSPASLIGETDCRTVAFEVGMQNGGMATGLAMDVLHSTIAALPPNVFGTWMNISGSLLANWWSRRSQRPISQSIEEPSDALNGEF